MTQQQLNTLSSNRQLRNLLFNASCIADRRAGNMQVLLFELHHRFTEVFFSKTGERILRSRSFEDTEELRPYLE